MLLGKKQVNSDKPDYYGRIPLSYAAEAGDERVVIMLLGQEKVNPTSQIITAEHHSQTPLGTGMREL